MDKQQTQELQNKNRDYINKKPSVSYKIDDL